MKTLAIFVHQPQCSVQSANGVMQALAGGYRFKIFTRHEIESDFFHDVDAVVVPGGTGDADTYDRLMPNHVSAIRHFVAAGGQYIGICMGAYWAGRYYFDMLQDIEVEQYIRQPITNTRRPHPKAMPVTWQGHDTRMYFYDGACFVGSGPHKVLATYETGQAMAIHQNGLTLIGCHPESQQDWFADHSWMPRHWHGGYHHVLLRRLVDQVLDNELTLAH